MRPTSLRLWDSLIREATCYVLLSPLGSCDPQEARVGAESLRGKAAAVKTWTTSSPINNPSTVCQIPTLSRTGSCVPFKEIAGEQSLQRMQMSRGVRTVTSSPEHQPEAKQKKKKAGDDGREEEDKEIPAAI